MDTSFSRDLLALVKCPWLALQLTTHVPGEGSLDELNKTSTIAFIVLYSNSFSDIPLWLGKCRERMMIRLYEY